MSDPIKIWFQTNISPVVAKIKDDLNSLIHQSKKLDDQLPVDPPIDTKKITTANFGFKKLLSSVGLVTKGIGGLGVKAASAALAIGKLVTVGAWNLLKNAIIGVSTAITGIGIGGLKAAGDMEKLQLQLETVLGDAERAKQAFDESFDFSVATPFSPEEIVETRIALESVGIKGQSAVTSVATAAAAMGRNILDVASAVRSLETEPLRNLGISLKRQGDQFVFSYKDAIGRTNEVTASSFEEAQQQLLEILGTRFEGGLEKMSASFQGKMSTLWGNIKAGFADFGSGYLDDVKGYIDSINEGINQLRDSGILKKLGESVGKYLDGVVKRAAGIIKFLQNGGDASDVVNYIGLKLKEFALNAAQVAYNKLAEVAPKIGSLIAQTMSNYLASEKEAERLANLEVYGKEKLSPLDKDYWKFFDPEFAAATFKHMGNLAVDKVGGTIKPEERNSWGAAAGAQADVFADKIWPPIEKLSNAADKMATQSESSNKSIVVVDGKEIPWDEYMSQFQESAKAQVDAAQKLSETASESATAQSESATATTQHLTSLTQTSTAISKTLQTASTTLAGINMQANQFTTFMQNQTNTNAALAAQLADINRQNDAIQRQITSMRA